jgi:DNA-binding PadR family transcriptional regulator
MPERQILTRETLGQFEQLILTAIMTVGKGSAYGVPIYDEVCKLAEKRINFGSLYVTLDRLERKGLVSSRLTDPRKEPRGRSKRFYQLESDGLRLLQESVATSLRVADALSGKWSFIRKWSPKGHA